MNKSGRLQLRINDEAYERWTVEAKKRGLSLSEFIRLAVEGSLMVEVVGKPVSAQTRGRPGPIKPVTLPHPSPMAFKGPDFKPGKK